MASPSKRILIVSKPLHPPWNDGTKNLVHGLLQHLPEYSFHVFTIRDSPFRLPHVYAEEVLPRANDFSLSMSQKARLWARLLRPPREVAGIHFFYTPNPAAHLFARLIRKRWGRKVFHTVTSFPRDLSLVGRRCPADVLIALSDWSYRRIQEAGFPFAVRIYPGVSPVSPAAGSNPFEDQLRPRERFLLLYPGDYEISGAPGIIIRALPAILREAPESLLILTCRMKNREARRVHRSIRHQVEKLRLGRHVVFLNEVDSMDPLLRVCHVCLFPVSSLVRKMDLPLVLLEAMAHGKPLIVSDVGALRELMPDQNGSVVPQGDSEALAEAILNLYRDETGRLEMGRRAEKVSRERFDIRRMAREYAGLYDRTLT